MRKVRDAPSTGTSVRSSRGLITGYYKRGYIDSWDITDFNGNVFNVDDNEITQILSRVKQ